MPSTKENLTFILETLSPLQTQIANAIICLKEKSKFTESVLCKKLREIAKISQKQKAHIALIDIENALKYVFDTESVNFSVIVTSSNELLFEKCIEPKPLSLEARQRRQKSEKSMTLFTNSDVIQKKSNKNKPKHNERTKRKSLNIYDNVNEWER